MSTDHRHPPGTPVPTRKKWMFPMFPQSQPFLMWISIAILEQHLFLVWFPRHSVGSLGLCRIGGTCRNGLRGIHPAPIHRQVMMFSATMSAETRALCKKPLGGRFCPSPPAGASARSDPAMRVQAVWAQAGTSIRLGRQNIHQLRASVIRFGQKIISRRCTSDIQRVWGVQLFEVL